VSAALWLLTGGMTGVIHALSLWRAVARLHPGVPAHAALSVLSGMFLRWGLTAGLLVAALQRGPATCLLAFAGLWLGRFGLVCWLGSRNCAQ